MTQLLLYNHPTFLHLQEPWVDELLQKERGVKDKNGKNCLVYLLDSKKLRELDFENERFRNMLEA